MKPTVKKLLDDIQRVLKREKRTIADLSRDLDRDYHQVYDWFVRRQFNPQADALMELMAWYDKHKIILVRSKRAVPAQST
jgi:hypothetical protein